MKKLTNLRVWLAAALLLSVSALLNGCASTAEGITRALVDGGKEPAPRLCRVSGPAFTGLEGRLDTPEGELSGKTMRLVLVHGIGTHEPGWSTPLLQRLALKVGLHSIDRNVKRVDIVSEKFPGEALGQLTVIRMFDRDSGTQIVAYELSWSAITEKWKRGLAYDTTGISASSRAEFNQGLKVFLNDRLLDPVAYLGTANGRILEAAGRALCFSSLPDWRAIPESGPAECQLDSSMDLDPMRNAELVYITHSLGSRIVTDAFQTQTAELRERLKGGSLSADDRVFFTEFLKVLQGKQPRIYMMANQLPLMDVALPPPRVVSQIDEYCEPDGEHYDERILSRLSVVAFSDPNDPLSYGLPFNYANAFMDSRLCPVVVNVSVNVTDVLDPLGLVEIAPPLEAHAGYEEDDTVLNIMARGVGTPNAFPEVAERCTWAKIE